MSDDFVKDIEQITEASKEPAPEKGPKKKTTTAFRQAPLRGRIIEFYTGVGLMVSMRDPQCGAAVGAVAESAADAWEDVCKQNPKLRAVVERFLSGGVYGALLFAHMPLVMAVATHHNILPTALAEVGSNGNGQIPGDPSTIPDLDGVS